MYTKRSPKRSPCVESVDFDSDSEERSFRWILSFSSSKHLHGSFHSSWNSRNRRWISSRHLFFPCASSIKHLFRVVGSDKLYLSWIVCYFTSGANYSFREASKLPLPFAVYFHVGEPLGRSLRMTDRLCDVIITVPSTPGRDAILSGVANP